LEKCCIGIENGKITQIKKVLKGDKFYDFGDKLIIPAGIDIHVHFRDPGLTHKEDFESGTLAASFGGIGCVIDMPNTVPPVTNIDSLQDKLRIVQRKAFIDFGLYSAVSAKSNLEKLAQLSTGLKMYMGETTGKLTYQDFPDLMNKLQPLINGPETVLAVHAEQSEILAEAALKITDERYKNLSAHAARRPSIAEVKAIKNLLGFRSNFLKFIKTQRGGSQSSTSPVKFHLCHISSARSLKALTNIRDVTTEVTPHHLFLSIKSAGNLKAFAKVNPPLRTVRDRASLWQGLCNGQINIVASDHAPHTSPEKDQAFPDAPAGIPGVECTMPLLLSTVKHGMLTLERFVDATSVQPAKLFGMNKGVLEIGYDADLAVVDMKNEVQLKTNMLHSKCEWTPYRNKNVIFPIMTISHGKVIIKNGSIESEPGEGIYQKPINRR
jgi:dihydroorotase